MTCPDMGVRTFCGLRKKRKKYPTGKFYCSILSLKFLVDSLSQYRSCKRCYCF